MLNVAAYLAIVTPTDVLGAKEIGAVLPFGAVLAGRMLGDRALAEKAGLALGVVLTGYAAMLGYGAAQPAQAPQYADLTAWLQAHDLTSGVSGFAQANIVTVQSGGSVMLRPVNAQGLYIQAQQWQAKSSWYDPTQRATFLILRSYGAYEVREREAVATFGPPARTYRYREFTILVWNENIYTHLR